MTSHPAVPHSAQLLAAQLFESGLLNEIEAGEYRQRAVLPADFGERVLDRHMPAHPAPVAAGIVSSLVIASEPVAEIAPTRLTYDGPCPEALSYLPTHTPAISLHEVSVGRLFLGLEQTTLILDRDSYWVNTATPASRWIAPAFADAPVQHLKGTAAVLFADGASLFSHWMFDLLPKLEVLRRAEWDLERVDHYVVNSIHAEFQVESLRALGIPKEKVVHGTGRLITADRLLILSPVRFAWLTPRWARDFIRDTFAPCNVASGDGTSHRRLYISRDRSRFRRILNAGAIQAILDKHGFETVYAEHIPVAEMASLVSSAGKLITSHGAGITNVVFAQPGMSVLEMFGAHICAEGWLMTSGVGGRHFVLAGKDEQGRYPWQEGAYQGLSRLERNRANFVVDPVDLQRALDVIAEG